MANSKGSITTATFILGKLIERMELKEYEEFTVPMVYLLSDAIHRTTLLYDGPALKDARKGAVGVVVDMLAALSTTELKDIKSGDTLVYLMADSTWNGEEVLIPNIALCAVYNFYEHLETHLRLTSRYSKDVHLRALVRSNRNFVRTTFQLSSSTADSTNRLTACGATIPEDLRIAMEQEVLNAIRQVVNHWRVQYPQTEDGQSAPEITTTTGDEDDEHF